MTIDEAMAQAVAVLDEVYADALKQGIAMLNTHGEPIEEEIETFVSWYEPMLQTNRADNLSRLRHAGLCGQLRHHHIRRQIHQCRRQSCCGNHSKLLTRFPE